jgi:hypothetical protein
MRRRPVRIGSAFAYSRMKFHVRVTSAIAILGVGLITSCGGDTTRPSASSFAEHLDSLSFATASDSSMDESLRDERIFAISLFQVAVAYGVPAKRLTVTTSNGVEHWMAYQYVVRELQPNGIYTNSLIATRDTDIHSYLYASYLSDGSLYFAVLTTDDTIRTGSSRREGMSTVSLTGSHECATPLPLPHNTLQVSASCETARFVTSGSFEFDEPPNPPQGYRHFSFAATSLDGERLTYP